ncbi:ABC transporter substrate-binding protein [Erythrobacter sp. MTPC3]
MIAACLALAGLGGCAQENRRAADSAGGIAAEKPRIVSLNPCIDALLVDIAEPEQVIALSHYSRDPSSSSIPREIAAGYDFTGGTAEEVLSLSPDIVLASTFMPAAKRGALERLGLRIETFDSPSSVAESAAQIERIGALTGNTQPARQLALQITRAAPLQTPEPITALLWQPGQIVPGEATLVGEMMRRNGLVSHAQALGLEQADHVSLERLLAEPPELLLVAGSSTGQQHPLLQHLDDTRVEPIETRLLYCGGRTVLSLQERLDTIRGDIERSGEGP